MFILVNLLLLLLGLRIHCTKRFSHPSALSRWKKEPAGVMQMYTAYVYYLKKLLALCELFIKEAVCVSKGCIVLVTETLNNTSTSLFSHLAHRNNPAFLATSHPLSPVEENCPPSARDRNLSPASLPPPPTSPPRYIHSGD